MYKLKCFEIPEGSKASRGTNVINLLPLQNGEKIAAMLYCRDFDEDSYVIMVTRDGKIKKTRLDDYRNVRKNGLIAIGLDEGDEIRGALLCTDEDELLVATKGGRIIRFAVNSLRSMGRSAHGVRAIKLREGDEVVSMEAAREGAAVLTVTDRGYGRRVELSQYRAQNRGGYGILNYRTGAKGEVCGIKVVDESEDVILISNDGIIIRVRAADISLMGRYSGGVTIMRTKGDDDRRVVAFTSAEHDDEAKIEEVEQLSPEELAEIAAAEAEAEAAEDAVPDPEPDESEADE